MKKLITIFALAVMASTSAFAEDFDNEQISIEAVKKGSYAVSLKNRRDGYDELGLRLFPAKGMYVFVEAWQKGNIDDYQISVAKTYSADMGPVTGYVKPEVHFRMGDSYAKEQLRLSPVVGVKTKVGDFTPFFEVSKDWVSSSGDYLNFAKNTGNMRYGTSYKVDENLTVTANVIDLRDVDFKSTDKEMQVKFSWAF